MFVRSVAFDGEVYPLSNKVLKKGWVKMIHWTEEMRKKINSVMFQTLTTKKRHLSVSASHVLYKNYPSKNHRLNKHKIIVFWRFKKPLITFINQLAHYEPTLLPVFGFKLQIPKMLVCYKIKDIEMAQSKLMQLMALQLTRKIAANNRRKIAHPHTKI